MTTIQKQIAERICALVSEAVPGRADGDFAAGARQMAREITTQFVSGKWDDILGKPEPGLDDVREEARRVFGIDAATRFGVKGSFSGAVYELFVEASDPVFCVRIAVSGDDDDGRRCIASAYAALRVLPSEVAG